MRLNHATVKQLKDANGIIIVTCNRCEVTRIDLAVDLIHSHEIPVWQLLFRCVSCRRCVPGRFYAPWLHRRGMYTASGD
jgi:hypothetical protein